jgi:hypothetical protein
MLPLKTSESVYECLQGDLSSCSNWNAIESIHRKFLKLTKIKSGEKWTIPI